MGAQRDPAPGEIEEDKRTGEEPAPSGRPPKHPEKQEPIKP